MRSLVTAGFLGWILFVLVHIFDSYVLSHRIAPHRGQFVSPKCFLLTSGNNCCWGNCTHFDCHSLYPTLSIDILRIRRIPSILLGRSPRESRNVETRIKIINATRWKTSLSSDNCISINLIYWNIGIFSTCLTLLFVDVRYMDTSIDILSVFVLFLQQCGLLHMVQSFGKIMEFW